MSEGKNIYRSWLRESNGNGKAAARVMDSLNEEFLIERLAELEFALEDQGWTRIGLDSEKEFSPEARKTINKVSRYMWLKNPLIKRAVGLKTDYTWGQGMECSIDDEGLNKELQEFFDDKGNNRSVFGNLVRRKHDQELQLTGNRFFVMHGVKGIDTVPSIRSIPVDQIVEIICNPEDSSEPWFYKRVWMIGEVEKIRYYPDWLLEKKLVSGIDGEITSKVDWNKPVYHLAVNCLTDMRYGVSEVFSAMDWSRAYKEFLEDWATIIRALAKFAWRANTKGSKNAAAMKSKFQSTIGTESFERNPASPAGSILLQSEGVDFQPIKTSGATTSAEDGRRLLLMVAAATDLPETFFGDANVGNHATAKTLDRPTELMVLGRQELWENVYKDLVHWYFKWRGKEIPEGTKINVAFPPVLEHSLMEAMEAYYKASDIGGVVDKKTLQKLVLTLFGVKDIDDVIDKMEFTDEELNPTPVTREPSPVSKQISETLQRIEEALRT